jgi:hypothetical protein
VRLLLVTAIAVMAADGQVGDVCKCTVQIDAIVPKLQLTNARIVDQ